MKTTIGYTRFPEPLHGEVPVLIGQRKDDRLILIDSDIDGFQELSWEAAVRVIDEATLLYLAKADSESSFILHV